MRLSRRIPDELNESPLSRVIRSARDDGAIDLTECNPTRCALPYDWPTVHAALGGGLDRYEPEPLGMASARRAVAKYNECSADDVIITASTSEAYTWLFKALCDPMDRIAVPRPSYPLLDQLATLEGVELVHYDLEYDGRWHLPLHQLRQLVQEVRALVVVSPNNPTGSVPTEEERATVQAMCAGAGCVLIADEVFRPYGFHGGELPSFAYDAGASPLTVVLDGLSKAAGLPHLKVGWMQLAGTLGDRTELRDAMEWVADAFLSVNSASQGALEELLHTPVRAAIRQRVIANRATLVSAIEVIPEAEVLAAEGGWYSVVRVPRLSGEEEWVEHLAREHGVIVHPGFFYDFATECYLVVGLLLPCDPFADGVGRLVRGVHSMLARA